MTLPISTEYLSLALQDGIQSSEVVLRHRAIGDLLLPSGQLVACDPFVTPEALPFNLGLPRGAFPVVLSVAEISTDQRVAFATVCFSQASPVKWEMMATGSDDPSQLQPGEMFGYGVDSGTGCFMDPLAGKALAQKMQAPHRSLWQTVKGLVRRRKKEKEFYEILMAEMDKTYRHTWSWLNMSFGDANLVAFSSGDGDGLYATYAGFDSRGEVAVVVTDFMVLEESGESD